MIKIESDKQDYDVLLPTNIDEIKEEHFNELLKGVKVSQYHCIVALIYEDKLFSLVSSMSKGSGTSKVIPVIAKMGENASSDIIKVMDRVIIDRSSLERGVHLKVNNNGLDPNFIANYIMQDSSLVKDIQTGKYFNDGESSDHFAKLNSPYCYFVEFKIIPLSDICGGVDYKKTCKINPFVSNRTEVN